MKDEQNPRSEENTDRGLAHDLELYLCVAVGYDVSLPKGLLTTARRQAVGKWLDHEGFDIINETIQIHNLWYYGGNEAGALRRK